MATEKRDRQRAARLEKQAALARRARRQKLAKRVGIAAAVAVALVGSVILMTRGNEPSTATSTTEAATSTTTDAKNTALQKAADAKAVAAGCPASTKATTTTKSWPSAPAMAIDTSKTYTAKVATTTGDFTITLDAAKAPNTVNNFVFLANEGFYRCIIFHRVIPGFMDQTGDPTGTGTGGPGYQFADELPATATPQYPIGSVAMANSGPNTNGSQFFIVTGPQGESLPPSYSLFGSVTEGIDVVQRINAEGTPQGVPPAVTERILSITVSSS